MYVLLADELLKMPIEQQAYMLSSPEYFTSRVRDMEQVLRRYQYIVFIIHACMDCVHIYVGMYDTYMIPYISRIYLSGALPQVFIYVSLSFY